MNRQETLVEKKIREAMEKGEFDNLPGTGKPLDLSENPFEPPDLRMVHKLLREAGFAPAWIEERKAIEAELLQARTILARASKLYDHEGKRTGSGSGDSDSETGERARVVREFREKVAELNQRLKLYNLKVPGAVFQRSLIDADAELRINGFEI
jgi:hypothetical protein